MRTLTTISLLFTTAVMLCAQEVRLRRVGMEQGLPQTYVNQICQDSLGYMWFGTQDGLARFDGRKIKVYRHRQGDSSSLPTSNISSLYITNDGTLCAGTGDGFCFYQARSDTWKKISSGAVPTAKVRSRQRIVLDSGVNVTYTDQRGRSWFGTSSIGLYMIDPARKGAIWYGTSEPRERRLASNDIWALHEDHNGNMWVGMNGGGVAVIKDDRVRTVFRYDPHDQSTLSSDVVRCFFEDNIGSVWIGTYGGGVCQYDPYANIVGLLRPAKLNLGFTNDFARGIAQGPDGSIYNGLRTGIIRSNEDLGQAELIAQWSKDYESIGAARALYVDRYHNLWIGSERRGVGLLRKGSKAIRWMSGKLWMSRPHVTTVSSITQVSPDTIAIGTDGGIALVDINTQEPIWFDVPHRSEITEVQIPVSAIVRIGNTNEYLVGTELGLFRGPLNGPYTYMRCPDVQAAWPSIDIIRSVVLVGNTAFVGTWNGGVRIINLKDGHERVIDQRAGLPSDMAYAAIPVSDDRLLISSNAGLVIWNHSTHTCERMVGVSQGAQSLEFNSWSWLRTAQGSVYLGGVGGVNRVRLEQLLMPPAPSLIINGVRTTHEDGDPVELDAARVIVLDHDANNLSLDVSAIALSASLPIEYRYKVSGEHSTWVISQTGELQFPSLAPGSYTIVVEGRYKGGEWGKATSIRVEVQYPFWQSWWFILALGAALSAIVWGVAVLVTKRRETEAHERERLLHDERLRIAKDLHDDVGTGLAKIVILTENSLSDEGDDESARVVAETAREVIDSVRSIVWVMKSSDESLRDALGYVSDKISDLFSDKGIAFTYHQQFTQDLPADMLTRRNIVLSVKECATNIVRHSKATSVRMSAILVGNDLVLEIRDDGVGFDTAHNGNGSGLSNIEARMAELGGTMSVETQTGVGTRVTLAIPIVNIA
ncbi:MAG: hypothetical protein IPI24_00060 [Ignavibacteria bacterium]|nr:hypothetical protein [Ignavibacteria bacterium]